MLDGVAEEHADALDVDLPCRVEASVVQVGETADGGGEVARETDGSIECVWRAVVQGVDGFARLDLEPEGTLCAACDGPFDLALMLLD